MATTVAIATERRLESFMGQKSWDLDGPIESGEIKGEFCAKLPSGPKEIERRTFKHT